MLVELLLAQCPLTPPEGYPGMVLAAAEEFSIDPKVLNSLVVQETRCNHSAVGAQGEIGLVQLHPEVWSHPYNWGWLSAELDWNSLDTARDPEENLRAGAWLLSVNLLLSGGDLEMALTRDNGSNEYALEVLQRYDAHWEID